MIIKVKRQKDEVSFEIGKIIKPLKIINTKEYESHKKNNRKNNNNNSIEQI